MYNVLYRTDNNISFLFRFLIFKHLIQSEYISWQTSWLSCREISANGVTSVRVSEQTNHNDDQQIKWVFAVGHHNLYAVDKRQGNRTAGSVKFYCSLKGRHLNCVVAMLQVAMLGIVYCHKGRLIRVFINPNRSDTGLER